MNRIWVVRLLFLTSAIVVISFCVWSVFDLDQARFKEVLLPTPDSFAGTLTADQALGLAYRGLENIGEVRELWAPEPDNRSNEKYFVRDSPTRGQLLLKNTLHRKFYYVHVEVTPGGAVCTFIQ